ncbi:hypothetical protein IscW_ISCW004697 [Ixodes scapularis]|uniref:Uncharacterized protein n=1 Tax=Ixodes scapularis TaxID=6945 RepID=B7PG99_IXOSC|nr:hypothetical protein IscW_ISCW004697 [Ixodes scapularis]|eukprot:XP_002434221.1 hypothetical protein IscW_ISCW004697 [Ixodes scapularis]
MRHPTYEAPSTSQPERQLVALSRTWLPDASRLVASLASNPIMARLGEVDTAALPSGVAVHVHVVSDESNKKADYPQQYQGAAPGAGQQGYQSGGAAANAGTQGFGAAANVGSQAFGSAANQGYSTSYPTTAYQTAGATGAQKPAAANPQAAPAYATAQGQYNSYGGQFAGAGAGGATSQYYRSGNQ